MLRLPWKWCFFQRDTLIAASARRRSLKKLGPKCEAFENRQLLSTMVPVATQFAIPSPALVTNAAAILQSVAPKAFAQFQTAMAEAEQHSRLSQAELSALTQDEAVVDQDIQSANISSYDIGNDLNNVQDWVDYAFTYQSLGIRVGANVFPVFHGSQYLDHLLENVPAVVSSPASEPLMSPIRQLIGQINVVADATMTPAVQSSLKRSYTVLNNALGPRPNTMPGPGGTARDPLVVFYDAQVNNFL
jgi:hypothetical protein